TCCGASTASRSQCLRKFEDRGSRIEDRGWNELRGPRSSILDPHLKGDASHRQFRFLNQPGREIDSPRSRDGEGRNAKMFGARHECLKIVIASPAAPPASARAVLC